ncbi:MAG: Trk system potassium transporter TrkA [Bacteroidales bacterium]|nr:Trk system potassium transporter TrkA [Bacteroidales bacterium]
MNIIIAGDGEVGFYLAKSLTELGHSLTVVDPNSDLLKRLESESDLMTQVGSATSPEVLENAGVAQCDLFLSVLHDESVNLMACILAKKLKAKKTVARISNVELLASRHKQMLQEMGIDEMVCPERIAAKEITNLLNNTVATEFFDFSNGLLTMNLIRLDAQSSVVGMSVREILQTNKNLQVRIVAVLRHGETIIPHADFIPREGDMVYIISRPNQMEDVKRVVGKSDLVIKNVMIAGGGRIGRFAALTEESKLSVTLVEENRQRCDELSAVLNKTLIINGDATDMDLMKEEGLAEADAFVAVTDSSETNILTCLHAKRLGVRRTIALVENTGFITLSQDVGIDTIINKKLIAASYIARFIVKGDAVRSKWLSGTNAELIEFRVQKHSPAAQQPIGDLRIPEGATVGGIVRGGTTLFPTRETQLEVDDNVVMFMFPHVVDRVARLFE